MADLEGISGHLEIILEHFRPSEAVGGLQGRQRQMHNLWKICYCSSWAPPGGPLRGLLGRLGGILGPSWTISADLEVMLDHLGGHIVPSWPFLDAISDRRGAVLGPGASLAVWGASWGSLGPFSGLLGRLGALLGRLGVLLAVWGVSWGRLGAVEGPSQAVLGPSGGPLGPA